VGVGEGRGGRFGYMVLDVAGAVPAAAAASEEVCDVVVRLAASRQAVATSNDGGRVHTVVNRHDAEATGIALNHCEPFVLPEDPGVTDLVPRALAEYVVRSPQAPIAPPLHRLARKILGTTVGIAMGGGAAYGIAALGVLKVLEDNGIPVDLLTGCSMGSIPALGYAIGIRADEMIDIARRIGNKTTTLSAFLDVNLTRPGLL